MMTDRELNEKLRQAYEHATPDVLDAVLSDCNEQKGRVVSMTTEKKKKTWLRPLIAAAACLCLLLGGGFGLKSYRVNHMVDATVSLDVNPSVELQVNQKERVLNVKALNEDGRIIVGNMDLSGSSLDVAVNALIGSMLQNGYLNELANSILISVDNDDLVRGADLQARLSAEVDRLLQTDSFSASVLSQTVVRSSELQQMAEQYGITLGKAQLIQDILSRSTLHTFDELAPLSINELNLLLGKETAAATQVTVVGTASEKGYIGEAKAKTVALERAGVTESELLLYKIGLDTHDGTMVYDVEFTTDSYEFDCDVNAKTGEIVKFEKEYNGVAPAVSAQPDTAQPNTNQTAGEITVEEAKTIALNHAGVKAADATFIQAKRDYDNGRSVYEIEFVVASGNGYLEYDYDIATADGSIVSFDYDIEGYAAPVTAQPAATQAKGSITVEEAKTIALNHAGLTADAVTFVQAKQDYDDGRLVYEIEFVTTSNNGYLEYNYEIDAATGSILSYDYDAESYTPQPTTTTPSTATGALIDEATAKLTAVNQVPGASTSDIYEWKLDYDDGRWEYEGKIIYNQMEFEFTIDAATGAVIEWDVESIYD
ncbi:MAG: PepSY domain-containing protein [Clostridiales bacterium]|nr:PepSY domain-containing protein [Clostridiales bacterium]